jgi:hypothetical protein
MRNTGSGLGMLFNLLAALFLVMSCLSCLVTAALFFDPNLNPIASLRPGAEEEPIPTLAVVIGPGTNLPPGPTSALPTLPPEWTPTNTPTITNTPLASNTPTETPTNTPIPPTRTLTFTPTRTPSPTSTGPTPTPTRTRSAFQFTLQPGSPAYLANFANNQGCNWFGVSGQAFDLKNKDISGLIVHIDGPSGLSIDALTGSAQKYGTSGYEITLGATPTDTTNAYKIQLRNGSGQPLSDSITFQTFGNCSTNPRNHTVINFVQNH